ncbi:uncharacterized protein LOC105217639 [Zeugodacus cucurbitae]|uniref:uncharacterized protein LOC105217639 n=1 Tax=Zeugodacus cucurbitae TaxID=28588 RepID=UPI0023D8E1FF|nr:uncharacterized protein LOC105217639 [Zeugodacus cucurbitae]
MSSKSSKSSFYCKEYEDDGEEIKSNYKRRNKWTEDSEKLLLQLWRENLGKLRACKKNSHILMEIVVEMELQGFKYNLSELKTKMHNMSSKYKRERIQVRSTGIPSLWEPYEEMDSLLTEFENGPRDCQNNVKTNEIKIKSDRRTSPLVPIKNHISHRDSESPCNDNSFATLSESDDNVEESNSQNGEDVAPPKIPFISVRENLMSTKNPLNNSITKVQSTKRPHAVGVDGYDDIDLFFLSMAKTVKKLPHHEQVYLKKNISNLVFEAELKGIKASNVEGNDM